MHICILCWWPKVFKCHHCWDQPHWEFDVTWWVTSRTWFIRVTSIIEYDWYQLSPLEGACFITREQMKTWDPLRKGLESNRWSSMVEAFSSSQYATGSCNILSTALSKRFLQNCSEWWSAFHTGHSYVQSLPELYQYQNYTYIRITPVSEQGVASHLIPSEATTLSTILDSQKAELKKENTHNKKALFTGFLGLPLRLWS